MHPNYLLYFALIPLVAVLVAAVICASISFYRSHKDGRKLEARDRRIILEELKRHSNHE